MSYLNSSTQISICAIVLQSLIIWLVMDLWCGYTVVMRFEWDEEKNKANVQKHGLDFADAWEIFAAPILVALDDREDYGEDRWMEIGMLKSRTVVVLILNVAKTLFVSFRSERRGSMNETTRNNSSKTNWEQIDALTDDKIDTSDIPPLSKSFFARATWRKPQWKEVL